MREALGGLWLEPACLVQPGKVREMPRNRVCAPVHAGCAEPFSGGNSACEGSEAGLPVCCGETREWGVSPEREREPGHPVWPPELIEGSGASAQSSRMALGTFGEQEGVTLVKCAF